MLCHLACSYDDPGPALLIFLRKKANVRTCLLLVRRFQWNLTVFSFQLSKPSCEQNSLVATELKKVAPSSDTALVGDFAPRTPEASDSALDYVLWDWAAKGRFSYFQEEQNQISWVPGFAQPVIGSELADMPSMSRQAGGDVHQHSQGPKRRRSVASRRWNQKGQKCCAANKANINNVLLPHETK